MSSNFTFTKDSIDAYLKELSKEFKKLNGRTMPAEIIMIGGASILVNYGFRDMTMDIDAIIHASSAMKEAINRVADKRDLPNGWLNADFIHTDSYTPKLTQYSKYYKTFSNILSVRTVSAEYLIAMKMMAGRKYKHDLSDIVGILAEHEKRGVPISLDALKTAVTNLYGGWESISVDVQSFIEDVYRNGNYEQLYAKVKAEEAASKEALVSYQKDHPGVVATDNANNILEVLKDRKKKSLNDQIHDYQSRTKENIQGHKSKENKEYGL